MIHAHLMNVIEPGSYANELNATLKENSLPQINLPKNPNSTKLHLAILADGEKLVDMMTEDPSTDTHNKEHQITTTTNTHQQQETDKQKTQENTEK